MKNFSDFGIIIPSGESGEYRRTCPQCSGERKKFNDPCLAVNIDKGTWLCHHCAWTGCLGGDKTTDEIRATIIIPRHVHVDLPASMVKYLNDRGITNQTIADHKLCYGEIFCKDENKKTVKKHAIKFPYIKGGVVVNAKYRSNDKDFRQEKNAEACLYRFDKIASSVGEIIICEGEIDALSCCEAGIYHATSVPNGAPAPNAKEYHKEFNYLESAKPLFDRCQRVVLAVDNDIPGKLLEQELARRIGVEKCYRVQFPEGCKDANDVLVKYGKVRLLETIRSASPYPVSGIFTPADIEDLVLHVYDQGEQRGVSCGWPLMDRYYTVKTGQLTIVTGIPGSGKSNWLDALMVNLLRCHNWSFAVFSPENWPLQRHAQSILEKLSLKPFDRDGTEEKRIKREDVKKIISFIKDKFFFLMPEEDLMSIDSILEKIRVCIYRSGIKGAIIDPWNEIDHDFGNLTETQYISTMLAKIRRFARRNDIHIWLVAHPQKLLKDRDTQKYKPPTMYEISGGAHWRNKADVGICVHRPDMGNDETEIYIQKVRFREVGRIGGVNFKYCRDSGTYVDRSTIGNAMNAVSDTDKA